MIKRPETDGETDRAVTRFFYKCKKKGVPPDIESLCHFFKLTRDELFEIAHDTKTPVGRSMAMALVRIAEHKKIMLYEGKLSVNSFMFDFKNNHQYSGKPPLPVNINALHQYDLKKLSLKEVTALKALLDKARAGREKNKNKDDGA